MSRFIPARLLSFVAAAAGVLAEADAEASPRDVLAAGLEANERLVRLAEELRAENARLREENARLQGRFTRSDLPREAAMRPVRAVSALAARPRTRAGRIAVITVIVAAAAVVAILVMALLGFLAMFLLTVACSHDPSCTPL